MRCPAENRDARGPDRLLLDSLAIIKTDSKWVNLRVVSINLLEPGGLFLSRHRERERLKHLSLAGSVPSLFLNYNLALLVPVSEVAAHYWYVPSMELTGALCYYVTSYGLVSGIL
jgi:hypothetical protein